MTTAGRIAALKTARLALTEYFSTQATPLEMPYISETMERLNRITDIWTEEETKDKDTRAALKELLRSQEGLIKSIIELGLLEGLEEQVAQAQAVARRASVI